MGTKGDGSYPSNQTSTMCASKQFSKNILLPFFRDSQQGECLLTMKGRKSVDDKNKEFSEEELRGAISSREAEARQILEDENKVNKLLENAKKMIKKIKNVPVIGGLVDDLMSLFELISDYSKGNYTKIPLLILVSAVVGVIYLVSPIDIIADFIPVVAARKTEEKRQTK